MLNEVQDARFWGKAGTTDGSVTNDRVTVRKGFHGVRMPRTVREAVVIAEREMPKEHSSETLRRAPSQ